MKAPLRALLAVLVFFGTYVLSWVVTLVLPLGDLGWLTGASALLFGLAAARWVWLRAEKIPESLAATILSGALSVGGIGFAAGFFGPLLFAPEANQGPLLGIFITGPAGFVAGAVGGLVYGLKRRRQKEGPQ